MKDIILAFLPPLSAVILTYALTNLPKKDTLKPKKKNQSDGSQNRHIVYKFFIFFLYYAPCFIHAFLVYSISQGVYMICGRVYGWPRIPIWWDVFVWWLMTAYMIFLVVAIQLVKIDERDK